MGLFDALFGRQPYSQTRAPFSQERIRQLVSREAVHTLSQAEEHRVEEALLGARIKGQLSLRIIEHVLSELMHAHEISEYDRKGLLTQFQEYIENHS